MKEVHPSAMGARIPYDIPVTHPGSAVHQYRVPSSRPRTAAAVRRCMTRASWAWTTPFGSPVVPLVKWRSAGVSGVTGSSGAAGSPAASHPAKPAVRPSAGAASERPSMPGCSTRRTRSSSGSWSSPPSTFSRKRRAVVTRRRARPRARRRWTGWGPYEVKRTVTTAPARSAPSTATWSSGIRGARTATVSPGRSPSRRRPSAKRPAASWRVVQLKARTPPSDGRHRSAIRSPRPSRTWKVSVEAAILWWA